MTKVIQAHHLFTKNQFDKYLKDLTGSITKGEHEILSKIQWYTRGEVSKDFIWALKVFVSIYEPLAIDQSLFKKDKV